MHWDASFRASVSTDEPMARRLLDALADSFQSADVVVAAAEAADNRWTVSLHFRQRPNETAVRALVALAGGAEIANALVFEAAAATDWVAASLAGLTPVAAGRFLVHGAHDRGRVPPNRIGIEIEAALAFGTGHHGTTRGCLLALDRLVRRRPRGPRANARALDLGTGSGVLVIAAARALRWRVLASDNDPLAVAAARANARHNRARLVEVVRADGCKAPSFHGRKFDLVLANILLAPLKRMAGPLARRVGRNGCVILSGLLAAQANAALAAYRAHGLVLDHRIPLEGWVTLVLRKRAVAARRRGS
jgi:ribosomal protein L11 methyltransferase